MASKEVEVLDPAAEVLESEAMVETLKKIASGRALNRRNFMAALGLTGSAAGVAMVAGSATTKPSVVQAAGPSQTDVLNFALNLEYLEATFYSYITQGTDLPPALTAGSGTSGSPAVTVVNAPTAKLVFTGPNAAQITDLLNEIYYDELNHVTTLRNLLGSAAINRPALNLAPTATVLNAFTAPGIARLLEDVGVTAYTGAASLLSGANLTYAAQILAVEGFHAGALRLLGIQNPATIAVATTGTATFTGNTIIGSPAITNVYFNQVNTVAAGSTVVGPGIPASKVVSVSGVPFTGAITAGSNSITGVPAIQGLAVLQSIAGTGIPAGTTVTAISSSAPFTLTISNAATATAAAASLTALINTTVNGTTNKTTLITAVSSLAGVVVGQLITGAGIPALSTVTGFSTTNIPITTGVTTPTSTSISGVLSVTGLAVGQVLSGAAIAPGTTITAISSATPFTLTISIPAIVPVGSAPLVATNNTITISAAATASTTNQVLVIGTGTVTISASATASFINDVFFANIDAQDVLPADVGPGALTSGPTSLGGFFATSGTGSTGPVTPLGFAFARTTSQVLAILYGGGSLFAVSGTAAGGFFPNGLNGFIKTV